MKGRDNTSTEELQREIHQLRLRLSEIQDHNPLTRLYNSSAFCREASKMMDEHPGTYYMVAIDINHFKLYNDLYGRQAGDRLLIEFATCCKNITCHQRGLAGHFGDDDFFLLLSEDLFHSLLPAMEDGSCFRVYGLPDSFTPSVGIRPITDNTTPFTSLCDQASLAVISIKNDLQTYAAWYDEKMYTALEEEQMLLADAKLGLKRGEFLLYLQPQCNLHTGKIVGMEALVRWKHPVKGMIPPNEFIPLFEKSGFITQMDIYLWEEACRFQQHRILSNSQIVPISVNVSRIDLMTIANPPQYMLNLIQKYNLDPSCLELEITESAYVENTAHIQNITRKLKELNFTILMDDFGSGYSSLNMLKDIDVDIIKLDMQFLNMDENSRQRGMGIIESVLHLAAKMKLRIIAEGVETSEHVAFLQSIGCEYAQGYYFFRPMPAKEIMGLIGDDDCLDVHGIIPRYSPQMNLSDLLHNDVISESMLNKIIGAVAIYEAADDIIRLTSANSNYYRLTGDIPLDLTEDTFSIMDKCILDDRAKLEKAFLDSERMNHTGSEVTIRRIHDQKGFIWMCLRIFHLNSWGKRKLYYAAISDVSSVMFLRSEFETMLNATPADIFEISISPNEKIQNRIISMGLYKTLGYPYEEYLAIHEKDYSALIHPDDLPIFQDVLDRKSQWQDEFSFELRIHAKNGPFFWTRNTINYVQTVGSVKIYHCLTTNITSSKLQQQELEKSNTKLTFLNESVIGGYHQCHNTNDFDFVHFSRRFTEIIGFSREYIKKQFSNKLINMIIPENQEHFRESLQNCKEGCTISLDYCMISGHGTLAVSSRYKPVIIDGELCFHGSITDVTELKNQKQAFWVLQEQYASVIAQAGLNIWSYHPSSHELHLQITAPDFFTSVLEPFWKISGSKRILPDYPNCLYCNADSVDQNLEAMVNLFYSMHDELDTKREFNRILHLVDERQSPYYFEVNGKIILDQNSNYIKSVGYIKDVTKAELSRLEKANKNAKLKHLAQSDSLTGLLNRQAAIALITEAIHTTLEENESGALLIFDLDNFKHMNDTYGHPYGDLLIQETAALLRLSCRKDDILCRLGGDEYLAFCKNISRKDVAKIAERINRGITQKKNSPTISIGLAMVPEDADNFYELYKKADTALYAAKRAGKSNYFFYEQGIEDFSFPSS